MSSSGRVWPSARASRASAGVIAASSGSIARAAGQTVRAGQDMVSANGQYTLTVQTSGNVVVTGNDCTIWSAGTAGTAGNYLTMQTDGNLVVYTSAGKAVWSSKTPGSGSADYLRIQDDGNVVVYTSAGAVV
jgi:pseudomonalisin